MQAMSGGRAPRMPAGRKLGSVLTQPISWSWLAASIWVQLMQCHSTKVKTEWFPAIGVRLQLMQRIIRVKGYFDKSFILWGAVCFMLGYL